MSEESRPPYAERLRRARLLVWCMIPPYAVAGVLIAMVLLSNKSASLLVPALIIAGLTFIGGLIAGRIYVQGGARGPAPDSPLR